MAQKSRQPNIGTQYNFYNSQPSNTDIELPKVSLGEEIVQKEGNLQLDKNVQKQHSSNKLKISNSRRRKALTASPKRSRSSSRKKKPQRRDKRDKKSKRARSHSRDRHSRKTKRRSRSKDRRKYSRRSRSRDRRTKNKKRTYDEQEFRQRKKDQSRRSGRLDRNKRKSKRSQRSLSSNQSPPAKQKFRARSLSVQGYRTNAMHGKLSERDRLLRRGGPVIPKPKAKSPPPKQVKKNKSAKKKEKLQQQEQQQVLAQQNTQNLVQQQQQLQTQFSASIQVNTPQMSADITLNNPGISATITTQNNQQQFYNAPFLEQLPQVSYQPQFQKPRPKIVIKTIQSVSTQKQVKPQSHTPMSSWKTVDTEAENKNVPSFEFKVHKPGKTQELKKLQYEKYDNNKQPQVPQIEPQMQNQHQENQQTQRKPQMPNPKIAQQQIQDALRMQQLQEFHNLNQRTTENQNCPKTDFFQGVYPPPEQPKGNDAFGGVYPPPQSANQMQQYPPPQHQQYPPQMQAPYIQNQGYPQGPGTMGLNVGMLPIAPCMPGQTPLTPLSYMQQEKAKQAAGIEDGLQETPKWHQNEIDAASRRAKYKSVFANPYESMQGRGWKDETKEGAEKTWYNRHENHIKASEFFLQKSNMNLIDNHPADHQQQEPIIQKDHISKLSAKEKAKICLAKRNVERDGEKAIGNEEQFSVFGDTGVQQKNKTKKNDKMLKQLIENAKKTAQNAGQPQPGMHNQGYRSVPDITQQKETFRLQSNNQQKQISQIQQNIAQRHQNMMHMAPPTMFAPRSVMIPQQLQQPQMYQQFPQQYNPWQVPQFNPYMQSPQMQMQMPQQQMFNTAQNPYIQSTQSQIDQRTSMETLLQKQQLKKLDTIPKTIKPFYWQDKKPPNLLKEYDVFGFDVDHCLAKYNVVDYIRHTYRAILISLENEYDYPGFVRHKLDIGTRFLYLNNAVWDIDKGLLLKLDENKRITNATFGLQAVSDQEIFRIYGNPPVFNNLKWPETTKRLNKNANGNYWVLMGYFESAFVPIIAHLTQMIIAGKLTKTFQQLAFDLNDIQYNQFAKVEARDEQGFYAQTVGREIDRVMEKPSLYVQPSDDTVGILRTLRSEGKMTFLTSNSSFEYVDKVMTMTLGKDWQDFFDLIIINARKPLFQRAETPFYEYDSKAKNYKGQKFTNIKFLKSCSRTKILTEGNIDLLNAFFIKQTGKQELKIANFGDHYLNDLYATYEYDQKLAAQGSKVRWDSFAVMEEFSFEEPLVMSSFRPRLVPNDRSFGTSYFLEQKTPFNAPIAVSKNFFVNEVAKVTRYAVPYVACIDALFVDRDQNGDIIAQQQQSDVTNTPQPIKIQNQFPVLNQATTLAPQATQAQVQPQIPQQISQNNLTANVTQPVVNPTDLQASSGMMGELFQTPTSLPTKDDQTASKISDLIAQDRQQEFEAQEKIQQATLKSKVEKEEAQAVPLQKKKYTQELVWGNNTTILHPKAKHTHTLIWLHGVGDSGKDYKGMFIEESIVNLPEGCKVILPTAKKQKFSAHGGSELTSWFNIKTLNWPADKNYLTEEDLEQKYDQTELLESVAIITKFILEETKTLKSSKKVFLGGFLQGCCLSLAVLLKLPSEIQLGGVFGVSGGHTLSSWKTSDAREKRQTPIVLYQGGLDVFYPLEKAKMSYNILKDQGLDHIIMKVEDEQHHNMTQDAFRDMTCFFRHYMVTEDAE